MKKKFSTKWKASKQPRKQRKYRANAPLHLRKKFSNVNLTKELRKKEGKRSTQIKKGDLVKIMRGKFKGQTGKILDVDLKKSKVTIEKIQVKKQDGSKADVKMQPSNLQIINLSERTKLKENENKKNPSKKNEEKKEDKKE